MHLVVTIEIRKVQIDVLVEDERRGDEQSMVAKGRGRGWRGLGREEQAVDSPVDGTSWVPVVILRIVLHYTQTVLVDVRPIFCGFVSE